MRSLVLLFTALGLLTSASGVCAQAPARSPAATASAPQAQTPAKPTPAPQGQTPAKSVPAPQGQTPAKAAPAPQGQTPPKATPAPQGQTPEKPAAPPPAPAPAAPTPPQTSASQPPAPEAYTYRPEGRRDPFQTLIGAGRDTSGLMRRSEGPAGMTVGEITVRGIMQSRGALVAMVQGPDNKTYIVHPGDKLLDGAIKNITPQGLVVLQEVNDPLSLVKQREVRKLLKSLEDAKE